MGLVFHPLGGRSFYFFDHLGNGDGAAEIKEKVDVILHGINDGCGAIEIAQDRSEVGVEVGANGFDDERCPVLRAENEVGVEVGEGLRHGGRWFGRRDVLDRPVRARREGRMGTQDFILGYLGMPPWGGRE